MTLDELHIYCFLLHKDYLEAVLEDLWQKNPSNNEIIIFNSRLSGLQRNTEMDNLSIKRERSSILISATNILKMDFEKIIYGGHFEQNIIDEIDEYNLNEVIKKEELAIKALIKQQFKISEEIENKKRLILLLENDKRMIKTGNIMNVKNYSYIDKNTSIINLYPFIVFSQNISKIIRKQSNKLFVLMSLIILILTIYIVIE